MKKPSELVEEIYDSKTKFFIGNDAKDLAMQTNMYIDAICQVMDEERERVDGILKEIVKHFGGHEYAKNYQELNDMIDGSAKTEGEK